MIFISLLFFLVGVGLLAAGLVIESIQLELGAVAAALVSALALYAGVRQRRPAAEQTPEPAEAWKAPLAARSTRSDDQVWSPPPADEPWPTDANDESAPAEDDSGWDDRPPLTALDEPADIQQPDELADAEIPPLDDEPDEEDVSPANVARVAARSDDVVVVDGRPRYHRRACSSLLGRETVPLPVSEARESGFTPCARCRPDAHLLGGLERPERR